MEEPGFEREMEVVLETHRARDGRRSRALARTPLAGLAVLAGVLALAVGSLAAGAVVACMGLGLILLRATISGSGATRAVHETRHARLRVTATAVEGGPAGTVALDRIANAYYQPWRESRGTVCCKDARGNTLLEVIAETEEEADAVLRALGRDAHRRRYRAPVGRPSEPTAFGALPRIVALGLAFALASAVIGAIGGGPAAGAIVAMALFLAARAYEAKAGECEIGADGVAVEWHGTRRFVAWSKVRGVEVEATGTRLVVDGEPPLLVRTAGARGREDFFLRKDAIHARLLAAWRAPAEVDGVAFVERLERGARSPTEWRRQVEAMRAADYRSGSAPEEDLWRVVEDHRASAEARVGAALALRRSDGAARRLRVAAESVASPRVRIALERAADPDVEEEVLDEALATVAAER